MAGEFELKVAKNGQFMFNLKASNGQVILTSELYKQKSCAENGIESVRKNADREGAFKTKTNSKGEPYFILKATNGQEIGRSEYCSEMPPWKTVSHRFKRIPPKPRWMTQQPEAYKTPHSLNAKIKGPE